jgi:hypothetical protein
MLADDYGQRALESLYCGKYSVEMFWGILTFN